MSFVLSVRFFRVFEKTKLGWKFLFILGKALPANLVPCWWVGWWLWRGLYLARHLFTLSIMIMMMISILWQWLPMMCQNALTSQKPSSGVLFQCSQTPRENDQAGLITKLQCQQGPKSGRNIILHPPPPPPLSLSLLAVQYVEFGIEPKVNGSLPLPSLTH